MKYIEILEQHLKCDFLVDLFETYDVEVIYDYDRTYEGIEDEYRASIPDMGLEFIFDQNQKLKTLFMDSVEHKGYNPFEGEDPRNSPLDTAQKAIQFAKENSIILEHREKQESELFGHIPEWVKLTYKNYSVHYSYTKNGLKKAILQSTKA